MAIRLIGTAKSRSLRVLWMLEELGLPYEHDPITPSDPALKAPPYTALNPNGRIPTLVDGGFAIYESLAINLYLARKYPGPLSPATLQDESLAAQWSFWAATDIDGPITTWAMNTVLLPEAERDAKAAADARARLDKPFAVLESTLSTRPFLLGDRFTVADLNVAAVMNRALSWELGATPKLAAWLRGCWGRDAGVRARRLRGDNV
jgi:glutathione S-transferase